MKKFFLMLAIIFISGILSGDVCMDIIKGNGVLLDLEMYKGYANAKLVYRDVFWNILYERIKLIGFITLLCFTPIKYYLGRLLSMVFSFVWGFFIMTCISVLGIAGVVVGITSAIPHGLLYGGLILMMLSGREEHTHTYYRKGGIALNIANLIIMILLLITGCVIESLVGTHFIPWVIRLSLI